MMIAKTYRYGMTHHVNEHGFTLCCRQIVDPGESLPIRQAARIIRAKIVRGKAADVRCCWCREKYSPGSGR